MAACSATLIMNSEVDYFFEEIAYFCNTICTSQTPRRVHVASEMRQRERTAGCLIMRPKQLEEACGAASNTRKCICGPTKVYPRLALRSAATWTFIMAGVHTRALTAPRPIKPTSPRCRSAWQPNPGRGSTYRRGKSVQTTETTCIYTVEEDLLLSDMRRFVRTETALSPSSFISKLKEFVRYRQETSLSGWPCFDVYQCADCDRVVGITSRA